MKRLNKKQKAIVLKAARLFAEPNEPGTLHVTYSCRALLRAGAEPSLVVYYQEFYEMSIEAKAYGIQEDLSHEERREIYNGSSFRDLRVMMLVTFAEVG